MNTGGGDQDRTDDLLIANQTLSQLSYTPTTSRILNVNWLFGKWKPLPIVFIPKKRKKKIFGALRKHLGEIFRELAKHREAEVEEGHLMPDHMHIYLSIPPKYAVSNVVGYISKARAQSTSRGSLVVERGISPGKHSGREVTLYRR